MRDGVTAPTERWPAGGSMGAFKSGPESKKPVQRWLERVSLALAVLEAVATASAPAS
jgi:hypothetical protein